MAYGGDARSLERVYDGRTLGVAGETLQNGRTAMGSGHRG